MINKIKVWLHQHLHQRQHKELTVENNQTIMYTEEQLMARLKFFIGVCLALTLTGIVFVVLYSLIFVTQPLNAISPIDQKFFELIVPIATFLTGTLSGIMLAGGSKEETEAKLALMKQASENQAKASLPPPPSPSFPSGQMGAMGSRVEPAFAPGAVGGYGGYGGMPVATSGVMMGFGGKLAPPPAPQPEL
jgi:hypothetical protein